MIDPTRPANGIAFEIPKEALDRHVTIRFRAAVIDRAKAIAERDGMTVSSWIRALVDREVDREVDRRTTPPCRCGPDCCCRKALSATSRRPDHGRI